MLQAKFGGFVSPLNGIDAHRDRERQGARNFSNDAASYAESHKLGDLMCEMLNGLVVSKPDKPVGEKARAIGMEEAGASD